MRIEERTTNCYTFIEDHKSSANIDTLLVAPAENSTAKLDTYDSSNLKLTGTATSMKLVKNGEKVNAVIEGTVSGATGYLGDLLTVSIGGITANVVTNGDKFTATADVTDLDVGTYTALVANATVKDITVDGGRRLLDALRCRKRFDLHGFRGYSDDERKNLFVQKHRIQLG